MFTTRKHRLRAGAIALGFALFATACGGGATTEEAAPEEASASEPAESAGGDGLPALTGDTVAGDQFDTAVFADQDVVVWFWAPW